LGSHKSGGMKSISSFYQQHAQCMGNHCPGLMSCQQYQYCPFYGSVSSNHRTTSASGNIDIKCLAPYCLVCRNNSVAENGIVIKYYYPPLVIIDAGVTSTIFKEILKFKKSKSITCPKSVFCRHFDISSKMLLKKHKAVPIL